MIDPTVPAAAPARPLRRRLLRPLAIGMGAALLTTAALNALDDDAQAPIADAPVAAAVPAGAVAAVHVEPEAGLGNIDWALVRHGEAAQRIAAEAVEQVLGRPGAVARHTGEPFDIAAQARAMAEARVMTVSMVAVMPFDMERACAHYLRLPGIVVQAAGNEGKEADTAMQGQWPTSFQCTDLLLRVGASHNGQVEDYSSRAAPDLVGENPWRSGFAFPLFRDRAELIAHLAERRPQIAADFRESQRLATIFRIVNDKNDSTLQARVIIGEALVHRQGPIWQDFVRHTDTKFEGAFARTQAKLADMAEAQAAEQRGRSYGGLSAIASRLGGEPATWRDERNFVRDGDGTSWSAPSVGGTVGAGLLAYPKLSDEDAVVAALISARKIATAETAQDALVYERNGRGLSYNGSHTGFGMFDADGYIATMKRMDAFRAAAPQNATRRVDIPVTVATGNLRDGVSVEVTQDAVTLRNMVHLVVPTDKFTADRLVLIAPDGTRTTVSPAGVPINHGRTSLSITTSAMLGGSTKGRWTVQADTDSPAVLRLHTVAVQRGSVADQAIAHALRWGPQHNSEWTPLTVARSQIRWRGTGGPAAQP